MESGMVVARDLPYSAALHTGYDDYDDWPVFCRNLVGPVPTDATMPMPSQCSPDEMKWNPGWSWHGMSRIPLRCIRATMIFL